MIRGAHKPHIWTNGSAGWICHMRGIDGIGVGSTPNKSYNDWEKHCYKPQIGRPFR